MPLKDIDCSLYAGQILGVAGISGNGQDELMEALTGEWRDSTGKMRMHFDGVDISQLTPEARRQRELALSLKIEMVTRLYQLCV